MKVFLIILSIVAGIVVLFRIIRKRAIKYQNPVDSITLNGTMGFQIGDSKSFVLSRIRHLQLATTKEWKDFNNDVFGDCFVVAEDLFGHIKNISFRFDMDRLSQIIVLFDKNPEEIPAFMNIIEWRISRQIGEPIHKTESVVKWVDGVSLYNSCTDKYYPLDDDGEGKLFLFIGQNY